jgi:hypothetical protein
MNWRRLPVMVVVMSLLLIIFFVVIHIFAQRTEAYKAAVIFIQENEVFKSHLSDLESEKLSFSGYHIMNSGSSGHADFKINVTAKNGIGSVYLNLKKGVGVWTVVRANLILENGTVITLR